MSNILEFPSREKQAYAFLTENLAALLKDKGADETLIAHATALLLKVYGEAQNPMIFRSQWTYLMALRLRKLHSCNSK